jgi:hypothetical protein
MKSETDSSGEQHTPLLAAGYVDFRHTSREDRGHGSFGAFVTRNPLESWLVWAAWIAGMLGNNARVGERMIFGELRGGAVFPPKIDIS